MASTRHSQQTKYAGALCDSDLAEGGPEIRTFGLIGVAEMAELIGTKETGHSAALLALGRGSGHPSVTLTALAALAVRERMADALIEMVACRASYDTLIAELREFGCQLPFPVNRREPSGSEAVGADPADSPESPDSEA